MIILDRVNKSFNGTKVLEDISFIVEPGEFVSITGHSGSGKTTIINTIIGAIRPDSGSIRVNEFVVPKLKESKLHLLRNYIGVVFQDYKLLDKMTVFENVAFALNIFGYSKKEIEKRVMQMLELVDLDKQKNQYPIELSGGEKQKVSIARAMIHSPSILIADEATGNLDPNNAFDIAKLFMRINEGGTTVLLSTHNKDIVDFAQKRVLKIKNGKLVFDHRNSGYEGLYKEDI